MIVYVEGMPGVGKTYYTVNNIIPELVKRRQGFGGYSAVFTNIRGYNDFDAKPFDIQNLFEKNSLYVIDEVQQYNDRAEFLFRHFCVHRHYGQDIVIITQIKDALPRKFFGVVERSVQVEPIVGSQFSRAVHKVGKPNANNRLVIKVDHFKPGPCDKYKTVDDGSEVTSRRVPTRFLVYVGLLFCFVCMTVGGGFWAYRHFTAKAEHKTFKGVAPVAKAPTEPGSKISKPSYVVSEALPKKTEDSKQETSDDCPDSLPPDFEGQVKYLECLPVIYTARLPDGSTLFSDSAEFIYGGRSAFNVHRYMFDSRRAKSRGEVPIIWSAKKDDD